MYSPKFLALHFSIFANQTDSISISSSSSSSPNNFSSLSLCNSLPLSPPFTAVVPFLRPQILVPEEPMSLGKRNRHSMRRTTSVSDIRFDLNIGDEPWPSDSLDNSVCPALFRGGIIEGWDRRSVAASQRVLHRRHSSEFMDATHFLRICRLCKRRLFPGRDIYMYRGDSAFCSLECRQQQMNLDERKDKCSLASKKLESASLAVAGSSDGETIAPV